MQIEPFKLERYFAPLEFKIKYLLSPSDCEAIAMQELLDWSSPQSLELWHNLRLGYTEYAGHPLLREEINRLYTHMDVDKIIVAVPEEAIFIAMNNLLVKGDHVISVFPAYQSLYEIARAIGCDVSYWRYELVDQNWHLDLNWLENAINHRTKLIVLNFPHNPTGHILTQSDFQAVIDLARKHGIIIFCDEMYRLLEYKPETRLPSICDAYEKGITLSGLSKSFAMPGLRIGWLASRDMNLINQWLTYKDYTTICNSAPGEILAILALRVKEKILSRNLEIIFKNLKLAADFFPDHPHYFRWIPPAAGSIGFPQWVGPGSVREFAEEVMNTEEVMIVHSDIFDYPQPHFRVGLGRKYFPEVLTRLNRYLNRISWV